MFTLVLLRKPYVWPQWALLAAMTCGTVSSSAVAQEPVVAEVSETEEITAEVVKARREEADATPTLDDVTRQRVTELYRRADEELAVAAAAKARYAEHQQAIATAPDEQQKLRQAVDQAAPGREAITAEPATLAEIEQQLTTREVELAKLRTRLVDQLAEPQRRADRRVEISKQVEALATQLATAERDVSLPPADETHPMLAIANKTFLATLAQSLRAQQTALLEELRRYDTTAAILPLRQDVTARLLAQTEQQVQSLQLRLNEERRLDAERQAKSARESAARAHPAMKKLADQNADWAEQRTGPDGVVSRIEASQQAQAKVKQTLKELEGSYSDVKKKVELVGLTDANGAVLRKQRELLPDLRGHEAAIRARQTQIGNISLEQLTLRDERSKLADIDGQVAEALRDARNDADELSLGALQFAARELLVSRRDTLDALINDNNSYFAETVELQGLEEKLVSETSAFREYIDERVLWIRSADAFGPASAAATLEAAQWLFDPLHWTGVINAMREDLRQNPALNIIALVLFALAYRIGRNLRRRLRSAGELVAKSHVTAFQPTLAALALTLLISIQWPALMWYLSFRLEHAPLAGDFERGCSAGLRLTALLFLTMEFFRQVCRRHGLADAHFNWPQTSLSIISRNMRWLMVVLLPAAFVVCAMEYGDFDARQNSLGRLAYLVGLGALGVFMHRILRPRRGALAETYLRNPLRWSTRLQRFWHGVGFGAPIVLAILAIWGYFYTALQLTWRLEATIWLIVGLLILTAVFVRWVQVARRTLAIRQAMERRAANAAAKFEITPGPGNELPAAPPATLDLSFLSQQARRLLQSAVGAAALVGIWLIWIDVLPALRVLNNIEVWQASGDVVALATLPATSANGQPATTTPSAVGDGISVTLADLLVAVLIATMSIIAAKNLPGLLEFTVLQRLPVESGAKFAIKTVASYLISVIGIVWTLDQIGIAWVHVQWLVAAISVGLGFGLQEIFGNFVSGLIILFERPIRVGDIVTVGQTTGCVSRIQIRATTISDGDRRELIVPNKDFITGQIVNWTLTDPITRVVLPVNIAYNADMDLAHRLLMQAARENAWVMKDPEPMAIMIGLGESALNFELRVFIASREQHAPLVHSLNTRIAASFREHGIEIAFPQRDLHIRGVEGGLKLQMPSEVAELITRQDKNAA
ncbi:MAG: mechanosensitive ion channel [Planctomycetia bacterium]|nr:mechanosensitive ion channel [Planctomycetia bacterium]